VSGTRIKICGITRQVDARAAIDAGVDALGLVFYPGSPRALSLDEAGAVVADLPSSICLVGLFVNAAVEQVTAVCSALKLNLLQFHGDESQEYCKQFGVPWMKALRVAEETDVLALMGEYVEADAILLDTWRADAPGGTGEVFNWDKVPRDRSCPLVLAGGLRPDNVGAAIARVRPYAVDVSGGVEASPGIKDPQKIMQFVAAVRAADQSE
jgi:phosphoribosylanthranilate isomerase